MSAPMVTALFFGYGTAGIIGTLIGGRLVARSRVGTFAGAARAVGGALITLPELGTIHLAAGAVIVAWGLIWGLIPLAAQVWMLRADPRAQEAASAANVSNVQISIAAGSAIGGLLVDSVSLVTVYTAAGSIALASAVFALIAGRQSRARRPHNRRVPSPASANGPAETATARGRS